MIELIGGVLAGSAAYAGVRAYRKHRQHKTPVWLLEGDQYVETQATIVEEPDMPVLSRRIAFNYRFSTISLGLTTVGAVFYTPLLIVSLPLNLFSAFLIFEDTWTAVFARQHVGSTTFQSLVVSVSLLAEMHLLASLLEWLYFLNQKLMLVLLQSNLGSYFYAAQPRPAEAS